MQTVLAIDDSQDIHDLLEVRLRPEEVTLHHALTAEDGLRMARELRPDLVLLDVDMPMMTGFEVCRRLKADLNTASTPIIFLSAATATHSKVSGFDVGGIDYVTKPFDPAELRARVRAALRTKRYNDLLATKAQIDALTGLWNRGYFNQRLSEEVAATTRYGRSLSLVLLDLDHFKSLNDTHGHPFGDRVLQSVGEMLTGIMRATDAPCRYGGEEFALILTETDIVGARKAAERVREAIGRLAFRVAAARVVVTGSLGVASTTSWPDGPPLSVTSLVANADDALYAAKHAGRNRVCEAKAKAA